MFAQTVTVTNMAMLRASPAKVAQLDRRSVPRAAPTRGMHVVASTGKKNMAARIAATVALSVSLALPSHAVEEVYQMAAAAAPSPAAVEAKALKEDIRAEYLEFQRKQAEITHNISVLKNQLALAESSVKTTVTQTLSQAQAQAAAAAQAQAAALAQAEAQVKELQAQAQQTEALAQQTLAQAQAAQAQAQAEAQAQAQAQAQQDQAAIESAEAIVASIKVQIADAQVLVKDMDLRIDELAGKLTAAELKASKNTMDQSNPYFVGLAGVSVLAAVFWVGAQQQTDRVSKGLSSKRTKNAKAEAIRKAKFDFNENDYSRLSPSQIEFMERKKAERKATPVKMAPKAALTPPTPPAPPTVV